jgi:carbon-monoxide dehydrogenase medium subunit
VKPPAFDYAAPESLEEAIELLAADAEAKVLAGGQSLLPLLNFRLTQPSALVDLRRVPGLDGIEARDGKVALGAMVRQRRAETDELVAERCPLLREALRHVAHPQIRSQGTVGGSVAHADPAAELPALLLALDGRVRVAGRNGERSIDADDFFLGVFTTALTGDEIIVEVELPARPPRTGYACVEVARRAGDYALCGGVCQVTLEDGTVDEARLALFGVGERPVRARAAEEALSGSSGDAASIAEAAALASDGLNPHDDIQASADYRLHLAEVVAARAFTTAMERAA